MLSQYAMPFPSFESLILSLLILLSEARQGILHAFEADMPTESAL